MTNLKDLGELQQIPLDELFIDHHWNHRGELVPLDVLDFARVLKKDGLKTPIVVQPYSDPAYPKYKYKVVSGHRRSMAFTVNKEKTIPGFIKLYANDFEARKDSVLENVHRKDLNLKQEAAAIKPFMDAYWTDREIADYLGVSTGWVKIRVMVMNLPERIQDIAAAGLITQEHVKQMQGMKVDDQYKFVNAIKTARQTGDSLTLAKVKARQHNPLSLKPRKREEIFEMIETIYHAMGEFSMTTRAMSWCSGQISTYEFLKDLEEWAIDNGKGFRVPADILQEVASAK